MVRSIRLRTLVLLGLVIVIGIATGAFNRYRLWSAERPAYTSFASQGCDEFRLNPDPHCTIYIPPQWILNDAASF